MRTARRNVSPHHRRVTALRCTATQQQLPILSEQMSLRLTCRSSRLCCSMALSRWNVTTSALSQRVPKVSQDVAYRVSQRASRRTPLALYPPHQPMITSGTPGVRSHSVATLRQTATSSSVCARYLSMAMAIRQWNTWCLDLRCGDAMATMPLFSTSTTKWIACHVTARVR